MNPPESLPIKQIRQRKSKLMSSSFIAVPSDEDMNLLGAETKNAFGPEI